MDGNDLVTWIASKAPAQGVISRETASTYATAVRSVMAALPLGLDTPLDEVDLDEAVEAFKQHNDESGQRSQQTVGTYASSFKAAFNSFAKAHADATSLSMSSVEMMQWQFPLRPGLTTELSLPVDLRTREAERLSMFIRSLATTD